jgi:hypothetical protein
VWWWVSWGSAVGRSWNLLLTVYGLLWQAGARWAKMTEWVVSLPSSRCLPARWDHVQIVYCSECFHLAQIK